MKFIVGLLLFFLSIPLIGPASATEGPARVALVIGNGDYPAEARLKNPVNDSLAIASRLRDFGFLTIERRNLKLNQVKELIDQVEKLIPKDGVFVFYYAGHGLQLDGSNYLPAVDASFASPDAIRSGSIDLKEILSAIEKRRSQLALIVLDACRDNPFNPLRSGLARIAPPGSTVILYGTRPGSTASDGDGDHGLFTDSFLRELDIPDVPLEVFIRRVSQRAYRASKGEQEPWIEGVIREEFAFSKPTLGKVEPAPAQPLHKLSIDEASRRALANDQEFEEITTLFFCKSGECGPYRERRGSTASALLDGREAKEIRLLVGCPIVNGNADCNAKMEIKTFSPIAFIPGANRGYLNSVTLEDVRVSESGGVSFRGTFDASGAFGVKVRCSPTEGGLEFHGEYADLRLARSSCFGIGPTTWKIELKVLLVNEDDSSIMVRWKASGLGVAMVGNGEGIAMMRFQ